MSASRDSFKRLVEDLAQAEIGSTFNFYRGDDECDVVGGAGSRRANLLRYLRSRRHAWVVAVGEAAGYQGARWSGIAFTSEQTLGRWGKPYVRSSRRVREWSEPSATIVHELLEGLGAEERVLLWNTVPTHPHRLDQPLSNRRPLAPERRCGVQYACRVIEIVQPCVVVAIGRVAESTLKREVCCDVQYVRHPANGGAKLFREGMGEVLKAAKESCSERSSCPPA